MWRARHWPDRKRNMRHVLETIRTVTQGHETAPTRNVRGRRRASVCARFFFLFSFSPVASTQNTHHTIARTAERLCVFISLTTRTTIPNVCSYRPAARMSQRIGRTSSDRSGNGSQSSVDGGGAALGACNRTVRIGGSRA